MLVSIGKIINSMFINTCIYIPDLQKMTHKATFSNFYFFSAANHQTIDQEPASMTIQVGDSVMFNCTVHTGTCDEEHSVYWFRRGSHPGIVHTHINTSKPVSVKSPSQSCVYHLQKMNLSSVDTGTYYCALSSCGEILFGNGSKLIISDDVKDRDAEVNILVWLSIIRAGILLIFLPSCICVFVRKSC